MLSVAIAPGSPTPPEHDLTRSVAAVVQAPVRAPGARSGREQTTPHRRLCPPPRGRGPHGRMRWRRRRQRATSHDDISVRDPDHFERVGRANDFDGVRSAHGRGTAAAAGDIPDNQVFLDLPQPAAGYSIKYPEGWAQQRLRRATSPSRTRTTSSASSSRTGAAPTMAARRRRAGRLSSDAVADARARPQRMTDQGHARSSRSSTRPQSAPNPVTGKRVKLVVDRYYARARRASGDRRPRHAEGRRQRRRVPADDRELPVEVTKPLREPERPPSEIESAGARAARRVQDLPLRAGRDGGAARARPARRARRARRGPRPVGLGQEHDARTSRPGSTSRRPARCAPSAARSRGSTRRELAALPARERRDRVPERQPLAGA